MRSFSRVSKVLISAGLACGLTACGIADFYEEKGGVGIPSPHAIAHFVEETESSLIIPGRKVALTPEEYVIASIAYTNEKCHRFFDILEHFKQDSSLIDKVLTAATAAGSPLLALHASKTTLATVTGSIGFANQYNQYAADIFAFSAYKESLMVHVFGQMNDYVRSLPKVSDWPTVLAKSPGAAFAARSIAADYASLCSLAEMRRIVSDALKNTESKSTASATTVVQPPPPAVGYSERVTNAVPLGPVTGQTVPKR